jgi:hypothetical protein
MSKELEDGVEYQDGMPVEDYKTRYVGVLEAEPSEVIGHAVGDQVVWLVTTRVAPPGYGKGSEPGTLSRTNKYEVEHAVPIDPHYAAWTYDQFGRIVPGINDGPGRYRAVQPGEELPEDEIVPQAGGHQLGLVSSVEISHPPVGIDEETGEVLDGPSTTDPSALLGYPVMHDGAQYDEEPF